MAIHPTAIVHDSAELAADVQVGPYTIIESGVRIGAGTRIDSHCRIYSGVQIGAGAELFTGVVLGSPPQDLKYRGEKTQVYIGDHTKLREYVTVNAGTAASGLTHIGRHCMLMAYVHVAHDCQIGDEVILANGVQMGGHVRIGSYAILSGMTGIHQFSTIGEGVFIGGGLRVARDVPPFSKALGEPLVWAGVNCPALVKRGWETSAPELKKFYREFRRDRQQWPAALGALHNSVIAGFLKTFFESHTRPLLI